ncbi:Emopamil-binding protein, partial [Basidiobolus meristosporus CBS 931.73]
MDTVISHPYYPRNLSLPHYVPNTSGTGHILTVVFGSFGVILLVAAKIALQNKKLQTQDRLLFMWCLLAGLIHVGLEGYYVHNYASLAGDQFVLGQVWKEYSKGDSRYLSSDPFVLNMERITAYVDGPLALYTAYAIFNQTPGRHLGLLSVSICQLYGDVLYFATTFFEGSPHSDPHPLYYWFYFVTMNAIWIVIPSYLLVRSWAAIYQAF